jgi:2-keto-4-pentenoate hydratase/2-oxohepta-3-ene-1,7-dioic acid hydratase in catechol pathway
MTWSLASYTADGARGFGVLREDGALVGPADLKRWPGPLDLLEDWAAAEAVLRDLDVDNAPVIEYDALLPPLQWPRKVICAGVNYRKHMQEMGGEIPAAGWRPFFFLKAPTTSVIGPHDPIVISAPAQARYDWEAELAVVIGKPCYNVTKEKVQNYVAGYMVLNDMSIRGPKAEEATTPELKKFRNDRFRRKNWDGSCPIGPWITPKDFVKDPYNQTIKLWVNGELMQDGNSRDMHYNIEEQIAYLSQHITLQPGDVITTGTPAGVGKGKGMWLKAGDKITTTVGQMGTLETSFIPPKTK